MTTHTIKGMVAFSCDVCSETYEPANQRDFASAWAEARAIGWRSHKAEWGNFEHQCPACADRDERGESRKRGLTHGRSWA